jgi:hypothetical protein
VIAGHLLDASTSNNRYACTALVSSVGGGTVERIAINGTTLGVGGTVPFTWASGDTLILSGTFEIL